MVLQSVCSLSLPRCFPSWYLTSLPPSLPSLFLQEEWQLVSMYVLQFPRLLCEAGLLKGEGLRVDSNLRKVSGKLVLEKENSCVRGGKGGE